MPPGPGHARYVVPRAFLTALLVVALSAVGTGGCASRGGGSGPVGGPAVARAENERGLGLLARGRHREAEEAFRRAQAADPAYWQTWNNLGLVYYDADDLYPAARAFDEAIRLMPGRPEPHNNLGLIYERAGQLNKAVEAYTAARRFGPGNPEYSGNLVRARFTRGDRDEDTRRLLEEVILRDARPQWVDWARRSLLRLNATPATATTATTVPSEPGDVAPVVPPPP